MRRAIELLRDPDTQRGLAIVAFGILAWLVIVVVGTILKG